MQEHLLYMGGGSVIGGTIPGEGNSVCSITDPEVCWYGEVSQEEFITFDQLEDLVNYSAGGTKINRDSSWLMFSIDGIKLVITKKRIRNDVFVSNLHSNGLTGQKIIEVGDNLFKVRLIGGGEYTGTPSTGIQYHDYSGTYGSEWNRLMYRICNQYVGLSGEGIPYAELANYSYSDIDVASTSSNSNYTICQEYSNTGKATERGLFGVGGVYRHGTPVNGNRGWRPVLELVP